MLPHLLVLIDTCLPKNVPDTSMFDHMKVLITTCGYESLKEWTLAAYS